MNVREHINEEQQKQMVGDGRPYEVQLEERILKHVAKFTNITIAGLKSRLGAYVPEAVMLQVLDRLVEEGKITSTPVKFELNITK